MLAVVFGLSWAQGFVVPLLLGIVVAYTLNPLVAWLETIGIPRAAGTVVVMAGGHRRGRSRHLFAAWPDADISRTAARRGDQVRQRAGAHAHRETGNLQKLQSAAAEVEAATTQAAAEPSRASRHSRDSRTRPGSSSATSFGTVRWGCWAP